MIVWCFKKSKSNNNKRTKQKKKKDLSNCICLWATDAPLSFLIISTQLLQYIRLKTNIIYVCSQIDPRNQNITRWLP